jgi:uncharacterized membrane protein
LGFARRPIFLNQLEMMSRSPNMAKCFFWGLNVVLGLVFLLELAAPGDNREWDVATIALACIASVAALARQLPLQNVLPAAVIAAAVGGLAQALSANPSFSLPFGPVVFNSSAGTRIFDTIPWTVPLFWVIAIFNGRGLARLMLRPARKMKNYGFWLIGLTAVLATAFDVALEPYAWHVKHFWLWQPTRLAVTWQGVSLLNFLAWPFVVLLILVLASPLLIRKQPGNPSAPDIHPLLLWLGALMLFAIGAARLRQWGPVGVDAGIGIITATFAVRGMRW